VAVQIVVGDEYVERGLGEAVGFAVLLNKECIYGAIENQGFRPSLREWM
jgi:hypothetical protein